MAMIDTAHKAPFGAISIHRATAWAYSVAESFSTWRARQRTEEELLKLSRAQLDDIGIALGDVIQDRPTLLDRAVVWFKDRRDAARTARMLESLPARHLEDIGLTQADVADYNRSARFF